MKRPKHFYKNLKCRSTEAIRFLRKTVLNKNGKKISAADLPIYLIIGPTASGKTTLLAQSEQKFILEKTGDKTQNPPGTTNYDFWVTQDFILIDTPGHYFSEQPKKNHPYLEFLKVLRHYKRQIKGILLVLDLNDILRPQNHNFIRNTQNQLINFSKYFKKRLSVHLLLNKCDSVPGFNEFFHDYSREERWQIWGLQSEHSIDNTKTLTPKEFSQKFNQLLYRLGSQLIWKMQYEKDAMKRALINQFPLQIVQLKAPFQGFIEQLSDTVKKHIPNIQGFYLTSATQRPALMTAACESKDEDENHFLIPLEPSQKIHAFFVHDIFKNLSAIKTFSQKKYHRAYLFTKLASYGGAAALTIFALNFFIKTFDRQVIMINQAQHALLAYQAINNPKQLSLEQNIGLLNALGDTTAQLKKQSPLWNSLFPKKFTAAPLTQKTQLAYYLALKNGLLPKITRIFADRLTHLVQNPQTDPAELYTTLQSYLLIQQLDASDVGVITYALHKITALKMDNDTFNKISGYLSEAAALKIRLPAPNIQLINLARNKLKQTPPLDFAYAILETNAPNNQPLELNLSANKNAASIFTLESSHQPLMSMYTTNNLKIIYPRLIEQAAREAIQGNWITGKITYPKETDLNKKLSDLTLALAKRYLNNYAESWTHFLNNIQLINFTDLNKLQESLAVLSGSDSPFLQLITILNKQIPEAISLGNPELKTLMQFVKQDSKTDGQKPGPKTLMASLADLNDYLMQITKSSDPAQKITELTAVRFRNQGQGDPIENIRARLSLYPEPIQDWLSGLTDNIWQLMLFNTQNHINDLWQKNILPSYQAQLENRFPFNPQSSDNVSLESFNYFFAQNGLLDQFFNQYLAPFIDTHQTNWQLNTLDNDNLQLSKDTLDFFERTENITQSYYSTPGQKLTIPFKLQFTDGSQNLSGAKLVIGRQEMIYQSGNSAAQENVLKWPDNSALKKTEIVFLDKNGDTQTTLHGEGIWGWFKLLQRANLKQTREPDTLTGSFRKGNYTLAFNLILDENNKSGINPFSLGRFEKIVFPREL